MQDKKNTNDDTQGFDIKLKTADACKNNNGEGLQNIYKAILEESSNLLMIKENTFEMLC